MTTEKMTERELLALLKQEEESASSYYSSQLAAAQTEAMERYNAELYGDEVDGRSKVVTHDIEDAINWIMPHLMRQFTQSDSLINVDDVMLEDDDPSLQQAADFLKLIFFKDNKGKILLHDFAFDGLLQRTGIMAIQWEDPKPGNEKIYEGITQEQLQLYVNDPQYEIREHEQVDDQTYNLKVVKTPQTGKPNIDGVQPEEFAISARAKSIETAQYHRRKYREYLGNVIADHPDDKIQLQEQCSAGSADNYDVEGDSRAHARFPDEPDSESQGSSRKQEMVDVVIEYIRCDFDGDDKVELRRIKRVADVILENDVMDESEFSAWSPIRVAHRHIGRSIADTLLDIQKIRTVITRKGQDSLNGTLMPRTFIDTHGQDEDLIDRVLDHDTGDAIPVKGDPNHVVMTQTLPDVSAPAMGWIEYWDRRSEEASGVTKHSQGISPDAITQTMGGIEMLQAAANSRIEMIARWLADALEEMFEKVLRLIIAHQDGPRQVKINGKRMEIDPRRWSDEMTVSVHVGEGSQDRKIQGLGLIAQKQEQILQEAGPNNPIVGLFEYRHTLSLLASAMGNRDPAKFFKEIPEGAEQQQPEERPDPALVAAQQKAKLQEAEFQHRQQLETTQLQHKQQLAEAELQNKIKMAEIDKRLETELAQMKIQSEEDLAAARMASEAQIAADRMAMEKELAIWKAGQQFELDREKMQAGVIAQATTASSSNGISTARPGGALDK